MDKQKIFSVKELFQMYCKTNHVFGLLIVFDSCSSKRMLRESAPYLNLEEHQEVISYGDGCMFFETEEEMTKRFKETSGQDTGGIIYALTCDNQGNLLSENT